MAESTSAPAPDAIRAYGDDADQVVEEFAPGRWNGRTVVVVHGGFWRPRYDRIHARPQARALADLGYRCLLPEYRRIPGDPDASVDDLCRAVSTLDAGACTLIGHSAGGQLALITAIRTRAAAAIALAGVVDLALAESLDLGNGAVRDFLGVVAADRPDLDPARQPRPDVPVRLIHGTVDEDVPLSVSESLAAAWHCPLTVLADTGHMALIEPSSTAWPAVTQAVAAIVPR
jgi:acetyl esterase/lipase